MAWCSRTLVAAISKSRFGCQGRAARCHGYKDYKDSRGYEGR